MLAAWLFIAISNSRCTNPSAPQLAETGRPALHAVHEARLRTIMANLRSQALARVPQEMDRRSIDARRADELTAASEALADSARAIPDALAGVRMGDENRRVFNAYAQKLEEQAVELGDLARNHRMQAVQAKFGELISTCNACHSSFRVLPAIPLEGENEQL